MKIRKVIKWAAVAISVAMPFTVVNMVSAYVDNGSAMARASLIQTDVVRLAQLAGDIRILPPADASALLARHGLNSPQALQTKIEDAQASFAQSRADVESTSRRVWRNTAIGFFLRSDHQLALCDPG
ncbi:hypothetical protein H3V53_14880 [Paraburkholderia bengalensis]|uniref:Methyl-accepting chemotaxis protein n=1 Tax=Paraburkholderia bengalensis TaxID=2747562 RepID=A0ABU8ISJ2_9BURK